MARIEFTLNGENKLIECDERARLLDILRIQFGLTGTKEGCGEGECGACAVLLNHEIVNACLLPMGRVKYQEIVTIEGFAKTKRYDVLAAAYKEAAAVQCGFCTPGMIIASESLLNKNPEPTDEEIRQYLSGNLCRCTGYNMIVSAIQIAMERGDGIW